jgi:hypothetical protein
MLTLTLLLPAATALSEPKCSTPNDCAGEEWLNIVGCAAQGECVFAQDREQLSPTQHEVEEPEDTTPDEETARFAANDTRQGSRGPSRCNYVFESQLTCKKVNNVGYRLFRVVRSVAPTDSWMRCAQVGDSVYTTPPQRCSQQQIDDLENPDLWDDECGYVWEQQPHCDEYGRSTERLLRVNPQDGFTGVCHYQGYERSLGLTQECLGEDWFKRREPVDEDSTCRYVFEQGSERCEFIWGELQLTKYVIAANPKRTGQCFLAKSRTFFPNNACSQTELDNLNNPDLWETECGYEWERPSCKEHTAQEVERLWRVNKQPDFSGSCHYEGYERPREPALTQMCLGEDYYKPREAVDENSDCRYVFEQGSQRCERFVGGQFLRTKYLIASNPQAGARCYPAKNRVQINERCTREEAENLDNGDLWEKECGYVWGEPKCDRFRRLVVELVQVHPDSSFTGRCHPVGYARVQSVPEACRGADAFRQTDPVDERSDCRYVFETGRSCVNFVGGPQWAKYVVALNPRGGASCRLPGSYEPTGGRCSLQ